MWSRKSPNLKSSFRYALSGWAEAVKKEKNLRWQLLALVVALLASLWFHISAVELSLILLVSALVLGLEFVNSALEHLEDILHPQYHEAVRRSKDMAAAAVLTASIAAVVIAMIIFGPKLLP